MALLIIPFTLVNNLFKFVERSLEKIVVLTKVDFLILIIKAKVTFIFDPGNCQSSNTHCREQLR